MCTAGCCLKDYWQADMGCLSAGGGFFNPFNLEIKQIANTNVLNWAGRTFALHEVRVDQDMRDKQVIAHLDCLRCMPGPKIESFVCLSSVEDPPSSQSSP